MNRGERRSGKWWFEREGVPERVRQLWLDGLSASKIGAWFNVSKDAVIGYVHLHHKDLPARPDPIIRTGRKPKHVLLSDMPDPAIFLPPIEGYGAFCEDCARELMPIVAPNVDPDRQIGAVAIANRRRRRGLCPVAGV